MKEIFALTLLLVLAPVQAEIFKWVDTTGNIHYGDNPPDPEIASKVDLPEPAPVQESGVSSIEPAVPQGQGPSGRSAVMLDDLPLPIKKLSPEKN